MTDSKNFAPSRLRVNDLLEQHFDTAFAAPDGIKKLRELILTLAMQGKLVAQDPNDAPASELVKEIEAEKQRLVKADKIKKPKPLPPIKPEEVPYELPQGWEWVRLGTVAEVNGGFAFKSSKYTNDGVRVIRISDFDEKGFKNDKVVRYSYSDDLSGFSLDSNNILMAMTGGTVGKSLLVKSLPEPMVVNQRVATIKMFKGVVPEFINGLIRTNLIQSVIQAAKNSTNDNISMGDITGFFVPLPPLPEQQRIVERIDQMMARCDKLENLRKEREEKWLAVHAAAINKLLDPSFAPSRLRVQNFLFSHFGELYTVKENVAELRKAILQLAVMGRLVPQDPNDPPASELLKEIEAEKKRISREGAKARRKEKELPPIKLDEIPYELPQGWEWVRLGEVAEIISGFAYKSTLFKNEGDKQVLRLGNIRPDQLRLSENPVFIDDDQAESTSHYCLTAGDILITMTGTREKRDYLYSVRIAENPVNGKYLYLNQRVGAIRAFIDTKYLNKAIKVESIKDIIYRTATGSANQANIGISALREWTLPLPPLPEQHRIVAHIDQLMVLCDTLDQQIDSATHKQTELLNAVMAQV